MRVNCLACNHSFALNAEQLDAAAREVPSPESVVLRAENDRLRGEVNRLTAELDVARAPAG